MSANANPVGAAILVIVVLGILSACLLSWAVVLARVAVRQPLLPTRPRLRVRWGGTAVVGTFLLWLLLNAAAGLSLRLLKPDAQPLTALEKMGAVSVLNLLLILLLPLFLRIWSPDVRKDLGLGRGWRSSLSDALLGVFAALFMAPIVYTTQFAVIQIWKSNAHPLQEMMIAARNGKVALLAFVAAVILAPIVEELMFRGIFQGWLERLASGRPQVPQEVRWTGSPPTNPPALIGLAADSSGPSQTPGPFFKQTGDKPLPTIPPLAVEPPPHLLSTEKSSQSSHFTLASLIAWVVPALLFAGVHYEQWPAPIPLFPLALALGLLYRRTASLVAPIAMHATFNALSTVVLILAVQFDLIPPDLLKENNVPAFENSLVAPSTQMIRPNERATSVESSVSSLIFLAGLQKAD